MFALKRWAAALHGAALYAGTGWLFVDAYTDREQRFCKYNHPIVQAFLTDGLKEWQAWLKAMAAGRDDAYMRATYGPAWRSPTEAGWLQRNWKVFPTEHRIPAATLEDVQPWRRRYYDRVVWRMGVHLYAPVFYARGVDPAAVGVQAEMAADPAAKIVYDTITDPAAMPLYRAYMRCQDHLGFYMDVVKDVPKE
jgi:hypothetical protein